MIYTGVIFVFLSFIPFLGKIAAIVVVAEIEILNASVAFIEGLPGAVSQNIYLSPVATLLLYLLLFSGYMLFISKNRFWLYPVLVFCLMLAADFTVIAIGRMSNREMVVQSINRHTAISFTSGQKMLIMADSAVLSKPDLLSYSMSAFMVKKGIRDVVYSDLLGNSMVSSKVLSGPDIKNGFFSFMGKRGVVVTPLLKLPDGEKHIQLDYVVLTGNCRHQLDKLSKNFQGAVFVADVSNSVKKCLAWKEEAERLGLPFYSVRESGAMAVKPD